MKEIALTTGLLILLGNSGSWRESSRSQLANDICRQTFEVTKSIETLVYQMRKEERIGRTMEVQVSSIKLNRNPYWVYMKQLSPKKGLEVLYKENENENKALVSPNGFPWMTLKMDPEGSTMLKNQHHTVKDAGYDLVISILEHLFDKYQYQLNDMLSLKSDVEFDNRSCHRIVFDNKHFYYKKYEVGPHEDMLDIAEKNKICSYLILNKNKKYDGYRDIEEGDQIEIPNDYSPRMELLIDKSRLIPLSIKVFDEHGLFENYQYTDVQVNPSLTDHDFSRENDDYGF